MKFGIYCHISVPVFIAICVKLPKLFNKREKSEHHRKLFINFYLLKLCINGQSFCQKSVYKCKNV